MGAYAVYMEAKNEAIWAAYNAAELKAADVRDDCGPAPVDHAAQAALENSHVTGDGFDSAYSEVFQTIHHLMTHNDSDKAAEKIQRLRYELV